MTDWYRANLEALGVRRDRPAQELFRALSALGPAPDRGLRSRQGAPLPGLIHQAQPRALVSTFDPAREAQRWAADLSGGTVVVWGGAGREAARVLETRGVQLAVWVEPRLEVWHSLLTWEDWTEVVDLPSWIPFWGTEALWETWLKDRYHPLWDGAFRTLEWRSATQGCEALWDGFRAATTRALDALTGDVSTQARFGERWYRNALSNLRRLPAGLVPACSGAKVVVAGAGPGLETALEDEDNLQWLASRTRTGDRLMAVDTALPALSARQIRPDVVFCLDGQLPTYHHFVPERPEGVPLVADLASLSLFGRLNMPLVRYLSGHPLGTVIRRHFPDLPVLDGSLGNVSGLVRTTALALGARETAFWGVDFGYREGQSYARGTYVYPLAHRRSNRLGPEETLLTASCYGARGLVRTPRADGRNWDSTPLLRNYQELWSAYDRRPPAVTLGHASAEGRWETFAGDWEKRLETLPLPAGGSLHAFVLGLPADRRQDWNALWPLALALHRQGRPVTDRPWLVVERALSFLQD